MMLDQYIQAMNPVYEKEDETKTVKYINRSDKDQISDSESSTAKQYEQELLHAHQIFHSSKSSSKQSKGPHPNCKIAVIQTLQNYGPQHSQNNNNHVQPIRNRHKKGKSMDLEQLITSSRQNKKQGSRNDNSKQRVRHSKDISYDLRQRQAISEMKQYPSHHKKQPYKHIQQTNLFAKKKKSKSMNSNQNKQARKQIRKTIEEASVLNRPKRKENNKQTQRSKHFPPTASNSKQLKNYSRSQELFLKPRQKKKSKSRQVYKHHSEEFRQASFSMPMTSRIINLFSNNSSVYSSHRQLESYQDSASFVIHTEQSCQQIDQIRQYENTLLKKKSSEKLRSIRKSNPIHGILEQNEEQKHESTEGLLQQYIQRFNVYEQQQQQFSNQMLRKLKGQQPTKKQPINYQHRFVPEIDEMKDILLSQSIKLDNSELVDTETVKRQEQQLGQLSNLIKELQNKGSSIHKDQKQILFGKIKGIIKKSTNSSPKYNSQSFKHEEAEKSVNQLTNSELKQSFNFEENMSHLNLELIDKALRQREAYLIDRKERELQKLEEMFDINHEDFTCQKQKIVKWIDHQIKSVVHTRHQLWKGFNIAKHILQSSDSNPSTHKKGQMMKCLSQKYLNKIKKSHHKIKETNIENNKKIKAQLFDKQSQNQLKQGRVASHEQTIVTEDIVKGVNLKYEEDQDQLLLSQEKSKRVEHCESKQQSQESESDSGEDYEYDRNNILNKPIEFRQPDQQAEDTPVNISGSIGLNIKEVQCDIEQENSYDLEELQQLTKESEIVKADSLKIPPTLTVDDKEDIYEFIFLDLCVQLTDQYSIDSKVIKKIFSFIKTMNEQSKKQKGFKTNTTAVKEYLFEFVSFLKDNQPLLQDVYKNLDKPLGPTAIDILKYMHPYDEEPPEDDSSQTVFILDIKLFEQFQSEFLNKKVVFEKYYEDEEKQKKRRAFLKNAIHIHNKAIFDALNETLDKERPYGVWGQPFSWKKTAKFFHERNQASKNNVLLRSSQKTIEYGAFMCGFMVDKEDCNLRGNPNISEAYIEQIRDDRLSRMLANDLQEGEDKMLFIDDEETEILVEVGHLIYQSLLQELYRELSQLI